MTLAVPQSCLTKQKPRVLNYRNYKFFKNTTFRDQVLNKLRNSDLQISAKDLKYFKGNSMPVLKTIASLKSRFIRANQAPFINKEAQRAAMVGSKLRKKILKSRSVSEKKHTISKEICKFVEENQKSILFESEQGKHS